jgi:hypothetical protein
MYAMTMFQSLRLPGILDPLIEELESTPSSSRRAQLIRKLALSHMASVIDVIVPYVACEGRVRGAAIDALVSFGEDARQPMLDVLGDAYRRNLHAGALRVLCELVRKSAQSVAPPGLAE